MDAKFSEQYRQVAKDWVDKDAAARLLKETKTAVLAQMKTNHGDITDAKAERLVKASPEWADFIAKMVDAETAANLAKVKKQWIEMRYFEQQGESANRRAEMKMT